MNCRMTNLFLPHRVDNSYKWAGGGFIATAEDVVAFAQGHMKPGYLSAPTLNTWKSSQKTTTGKVTNYGNRLATRKNT